jgi:hypothetical protein
VALEAAHVHPFPGPSPLEHGSQGSDDVGCIIGNTQVRPVEVVVSPRRPPLAINIESVVRRLFTDVGIRDIERDGGDLGAVGQYDHGAVSMHFKLLVRVVRVRALGRLMVQVPVHLAFGARHYRVCVDHFLILAGRGSSTYLQAFVKPRPAYLPEALG